MLRPNDPDYQPETQYTDAYMRLWDTILGIAIAVIFLGPLITAAFGTSR